uniref:Amidohydrolase-related domain-containing protein n=1 Tax=Physcomitrium patens TaxID=3218 RepID=A0A7I4F4C6_PHYPA
MAKTIDIQGGYIIPGLCDAHVHVTAVSANLHDLLVLPPSLVTARTTIILRDMLMRGFTTVRDAGGCDWGLAKAVEEGTIPGPRILFCGGALSQTGGHGDMRLRGEDRVPSCCPISLGRVCDGVDQVRLAAREELRRGAHHIKIMASGGVSSPTDFLTNLQFSADEISAIVEEARHAGKYVCAHAYTAPAIKRCLELGVRSIEHGNHIDLECIDLMKRRNFFLVPTLVTYDCIKRIGEESGMPQDQVEKVSDLLAKGLEALALADKEGVNICFGSDLLGSMHKYQLQEFSLRCGVQSPANALRSATTTCAKLFNMEGDIGIVAQGAYADLVALKTNPLLDNFSSLLDPSHVLMVMKEGNIVKRTNL